MNQPITAAERKAFLKKLTTYGDEGFRIEAEAKKIWKLLTPYHKGKPIPKIEFQTKGRIYRSPLDGRLLLSQRGHLGTAWYGINTIKLKASPTWETLAHELVHMAVRSRYGNQTCRSHDKVFYDCLRDITQRRFKVSISFFEVTKYGYVVDAIICRQLREKDAYKVFKK